MSKILEATCIGGVVTSEGVPVTGATILSKGLGQSSGVLAMEGAKKIYITSSATDLEATIDKLIATINKVVIVFTSIASGMTGPTTAPPGSLAVDLAELTLMATELTALKGQLK